MNSPILFAQISARLNEFNKAYRTNIFSHFHDARESSKNIDYQSFILDTFYEFGEFAALKLMYKFKRQNLLWYKSCLHITSNKTEMFEDPEKRIFAEKIWCSHIHVYWGTPRYWDHTENYQTDVPDSRKTDRQCFENNIAVYIWKNDGTG